MGNNAEISLHPLVAYAKKQLDAGMQKVHLIENRQDQNDFISPLGKYPHAYVLACIMDRQIKAKNAWIIPWAVKEAIGSFEMSMLRTVSLEQMKKIFNKNSKHRFKNDMAENFYAAVQRIAEQYDGDASKIWNDTPTSGMLVYRFLQFEGVGIKIATMATNILVRQFGVKLKDKSSIDVSPDTHIMRVFYRLGLISSNPDMEKEKGKTRIEALYMARALHPEYPGIVDYPCWNVGNNWCDSRKPRCLTCPFEKFCNKEGVKKI